MLYFSYFTLFSFFASHIPSFHTFHHQIQKKRKRKNDNNDKKIVVFHKKWARHCSHFDKDAEKNADNDAKDKNDDVDDGVDEPRRHGAWVDDACINESGSRVTCRWAEETLRAEESRAPSRCLGPFFLLSSAQ